MEYFYNRHYITVDEIGRITDGFSDAFREPYDNDILINDKGGYQFRLFPDGEENPVLFDMDAIPLYKWDGKEAIKRSEEEIEEDRANLPKPEPAMATEEVTADDMATAILQGVNEV